MTDLTFAPPRVLGSVQRWALIIGGLGIVLALAAAFLSPAQFFRGYLIGFVYWLGVALSSLGLLMIHHLAGGPWTALTRRFMEAVTRTLPLLALLALPLFVGLPYLYPWADPNTVAASELLQHKAPYLNAPFFIVRTVVYFAIWIGLAFFLNRWSAAQDRTGDPKYIKSMRNLSGPGLVLLVLTSTFVFIDYVMTLEPTWFSSIYGALVAAGLFVAGIAFVILNLTMLADRPPLSTYLTSKMLTHYGGFLLSMTLIWAYFGFSQYMLIWYANIAEETPWYILRTNGGWQWIAIALVVVGFLLPFLLTMALPLKERPRPLAGIAVLSMIMQFLNVIWLVEPAFSLNLQLNLAALVVPVAVGGIWLTVYLWQLRQRPILPRYDQKLPAPTSAGHDH